MIAWGDLVPSPEGAVSIPLDGRGSQIPNWGPASAGFAVVPNDGTDLSVAPYNIYRAILVQADGTLAWRWRYGDTSITFTMSVLRGEIYPFLVSRIMAATNATVALIT